MSPEVQQEISILRAKAADGSATLEDMKRAIILIRGDRSQAAVTSERSRASRSAKKAEVKSADDMLDELGNI